MASSTQQTTKIGSGTSGTKADAAGSGSGSGGGRGPAPALECPGRYSPTQAVLHGMFTEKVAGHILDSGDFYGRLGDAYRARPDMLAGPRVAAYRTDDDERIGRGATRAQRSSFHALDASLVYSPEIDAKFGRFCAANDDGRKSWTDLAAEFAAEKDAGFSLEGDSYNTYWFDNPLDAPFRWFEFDCGGVRAILVQVHLGCDMRGGYGRPRAFVERDGESLRLAAEAFEAACECTQIECWGYGIVLNQRTQSECEACALRGDPDVEDGPWNEDECICGEYPEYWKAPDGAVDGAVRCEECGAEVVVS